jgi:glycerol-3-phosphate dehydrogenase
VIDHEAADGIAGLVTAAGGKLAIYRKMAEDTADVVTRLLGRRAPCRTHKQPLPGSEEKANTKVLSQKYNVSLYAVRRLIDRHGTRAEAILDLEAAHPAWKAYVCPCEPVTEGEVRWVMRHEWATTLSDLSRRTHMLAGGCQGHLCALAGVIVLADELGLSAAQAREEYVRWLREDWTRRSVVLAGQTLAQEQISQSLVAGTLGLARELPWTPRSS